MTNHTITIIARHERTSDVRQPAASGVDTTGRRETTAAPAPALVVGAAPDVGREAADDIQGGRFFDCRAGPAPFPAGAPATGAEHSRGPARRPAEARAGPGWRASARAPTMRPGGGSRRR